MGDPDTAINIFGVGQNGSLLNIVYPAVSTRGRRSNHCSHWRLRVRPEEYEGWAAILAEAVFRYKDMVIGDYWCCFNLDRSRTSDTFSMPIRNRVSSGTYSGNPRNDRQSSALRVDQCRD